VALKIVDNGSGDQANVTGPSVSNAFNLSSGLNGSYRFFAIARSARENDCVDCRIFWLDHFSEVALLL
jgi:hypothetical protein